MNIFGLILVIHILVLIVSSIRKNFKSNKKKKKLIEKNYIVDLRPIRQLSTLEERLITPYLKTTKHLSSEVKESSLINSDVISISGKLVKQNINHYVGETLFYKINNIDVIIPYDMDRFILDDNVAEVVFTEDYAIVIRLNDHDIRYAAHQNIINEKKLEEDDMEYWASELFDVQHPENYNHNHDNETINNRIENQQKFGYEILMTRQETPLESAYRNKNNKGIVAVFFCFLTINYFLDFWQSNELFDLFLFGINLLAVIYFYCRKPKSKVKIQFVNRIRGKVKNKNAKTKQITVGHNSILNYPDNWQAYIPEHTLTNVELDVTFEDKKIIRYGYTLSVSKEIENFGPPKFAGRNLWLFLVGIILTFIVYAKSNVKDNIFYMYHFANHDLKSWNFDDSSQLLTNNLKEGDWVNVTTEGALCDKYNKKVNSKCGKVEIHNQTDNVSFFITLKNKFFNETDSKDQEDLESNRVSNSTFQNSLNSQSGRVNFSGLVSDIYYRDDNSISGFTINPDIRYQINEQDRWLPIILSISLFAFFALSTIFNGLIFIWKRIQNRVRKSKINNFYANLTV